MNSYRDFARIYDSLMHRDVDYEKWADYIENLFDMYSVNPHLVCDVACGTGNMTIPLAKRGYDMTGVDISEDMLNIARSKSEGLDILYLNQSMADIDLYGTMGAFLCMIDGINYVLTPKSLLKFFTRIKTCFMDNDGIFIFDISTEYKLRNVIGSETFVHCGNNIFYTWQNRFIEKRRISDMFLTFFVKRGKLYERFEERHLQRAYSADELTYLLKKAGFAKIDIYDELSFSAPAPDSSRIVFVCR
ncbi:MAG: class I SAM-dependent methyltransferase [Oscillospiraceae bacterium]|nr:class I SAM-dependent methyltransferase [Oscillospiraceae bacterium]